MSKGSLFALTAYIIWGFFPIYFKLLENVPALEIVSNRIVWSFCLLTLLLIIKKQWTNLRAAISGPRMLIVFLISALLLGANWLTYIYGVNAGFIVETSLGYYINPLVSVLLGVIILHEKLRPLQWVSVLLAVIGVGYLSINYGRLPWIALILALTFGLYGLAKKLAPLGSFYGLTLETGLLFLPSLALLLYLAAQGQSALGSSDPLTSLLLVLTGPLTAIPLLLFGAAAQRIDLSMLGFLQYIAPTLQFLIGVLIYHEPFTAATLVGFCIIWAALAILWGEGMIQRQRRMRALSTP
jgi:chloramphenicol-sensitive protein RarD